MFMVDDYVETRSDNSDIQCYRVYLDNKTYILSYEKMQLREVYFMSYAKDYFISCRTDLQTISHYYMIKNSKNKVELIERYEDGLHNRTYIVETANRGHCIVNGTKRTYKLKRIPVKVDHNKLYTDLVDFLAQCAPLNIDGLVSPIKPV